MAAFALVAAAVLLVSSAARADTGDIIEPQNTPQLAIDGWQAGPCLIDVPVIAPCTPESPDGQFFQWAGGHPPAGFVQFIVQHQTNLPAPSGEPFYGPINNFVVKTIEVHLPAGLSVNPEATPEKCSIEEFKQMKTCKPATQVGKADLRISLVEDFQGLSRGFPINTPEFSLFNLEPKDGEPALFGFYVSVSGAELPVFLHTRLAWESDYHESFKIEDLPAYKTLKISGEPAAVAIQKGRLTTYGSAGDGTFATLPTTCYKPAVETQFKYIYSSWISLDSFGLPDPAFPSGSTPVESGLPRGLHPLACDDIPFDPSIDVSAGTNEVDSPASPGVTTKLKVEIPTEGGGDTAQSHLRTAEVTLPAGMGLNPAGSEHLVACPDAEFHKGERVEQSECPFRSIIGTAEIKTPALSETLIGPVYLGEQKSRDPSSGEAFRIFVEARSFSRNVFVRLIGNAAADPRTGQLTARFTDRLTGPLGGALPPGLPQVPFEEFTVRFDGETKLFTSPPTCAPSRTMTRLEPWARPGTYATPQSQFTLSSVPGGGACPQTLAERPFTPAVTAKPDQSQAGAFSPFRFHVRRPENSQQEIKRVNATLPVGIAAKLAGVPFCPEAAIAAVPSRSGFDEMRAPSCPAAGMVGTATTESGTGADPLQLTGKVYLAGPYNGAPISMVVITPALAGPFDLGNVVIRLAVHVDPKTAQITVASDEIPDVYGGAKLDLSAIDLDLDRDQFTINPTSCAAQAVTGSISGGGADPTNPAAFSSRPFSAPLGMGGCSALGFKPKLMTDISGPTKRSGFPSLTATLQVREGDANVAGVAMVLPKAFLVAQSHLDKVCTRPQLAANQCPASSIYGAAEASSPLLDGPLSGPVYLSPGEGTVPDLIVDLRGQLDIQLRGVVSTNRGRVQVTFGSTPDVPLRKFTLRMAGGKKSLLENSKNLCKGQPLGSLGITGHNGGQLAIGKYKLNVSGCKGKKRTGGRKH